MARRNGWYPSIAAGDDLLRVVIPATSALQGHVFWQARALGNAPKRYQSPFYPREDALIVLSPGEKILVSGVMVVVEGPMDALAAAEVGFRAAALMGNTPPEPALKLLSTFAREYILVSDTDAPEAMVGVMAALAGYGKKARIVDSYPRKDLAETPLEDRKVLLA